MKTVPLINDIDSMLMTPSKDIAYKSIDNKQIKLRSHKINLSKKIEGKLSVNSKYTTVSKDQTYTKTVAKKTKSLHNSAFKQKKQSIFTKKESIGKYGVTQEQRNLIKIQLERLKNYGNKELSKILMANNQSCSGNKLEIMLRVAHGRVFGNSPFCPDCKARRLGLN